MYQAPRKFSPFATHTFIFTANPRAVDASLVTSRCEQLPQNSSLRALGSCRAFSIALISASTLLLPAQPPRVSEAWRFVILAPQVYCFYRPPMLNTARERSARFAGNRRC